MRAPTGFHPNRAFETDDLLDDPIELFVGWLDDAAAAGVALPNAMAVATADRHGRPSVRHVLLRGVDDRGFTFFTNYGSRKGRQLQENPSAGLVFLWKELDRQVCVTGAVERTSDTESDAYFAERPRDAQLGAWASEQSTAIPGRAHLDERLAAYDTRFETGDVPRPAWWGGFLVVPDAIEFWQGRRHRLHDRFRYERSPASSGWRVERLAP
jgi:pyridoxamine 5'-phosphate oxidase